jgi:phenylalanyl-tRNA synthetase beta chain
MKFNLKILDQFIKIPQKNNEFDVSFLEKILFRQGLELEQIHITDKGPILDVFITPNRKDTFHYYGLARALATSFRYEGIDSKVTSPLESLLNQDLYQKKETSSSKFSCDFEEGNKAFFMELDVGSEVSFPEKIQKILSLLEIKTLHPLVDISQMIMELYGQPTHCYDLQKLNTPLSFRSAKSGEVFKGLNGLDYKLHSEDLVMADSSGNIHSLVGILGSRLSSLSVDTQKVMIEFAMPLQSSVRKSMRRQGIQTDAGLLFSKGVNPFERRLSQDLFLGICRATFPHLKYLGSYHEDHISIPPIKTVSFSSEDFSAVTGITDLSFEKQIAILESSDFKITQTFQHEVTLNIPHWRQDDIHDSHDFAEEILHIIDVNEVPQTPLPSLKSLDSYKESLEDLQDDNVHRTLVNLGFLETSSFHFMSQKDFSNFNLPLGIKVLNPCHTDLEYLQTTLIPDLLKKIAFNQNLQRHQGRLYSFCRTYDPLSLLETQKIAAVVFGNQDAFHWNRKQSSWNLYSWMGIIQSLIYSLAGRSLDLKFKEAKEEDFGSSVLHKQFKSRIILEGTDIGFCGQVNSVSLKNYDLVGDVFTFEINYDLLKELLQKDSSSRNESLNERFLTPIQRDLAFVIPITLTSEHLKEILTQRFQEKILSQGFNIHLWESQVFDYFKLNDEQASLGLRFVFSPEKENLTEAQIHVLMDHVILKAQEEFSIELRK